MATYGEVLEQVQLFEMNNAIDSFLNSYAQNQNNPAQRTFIFFPGGMGSELVRAGAPFDPLLGAGQYNYSPLWVDVFKLLALTEALNLQMNANQDSDNRFIVADGPLKYCGKNVYGGLISWCGANNLDLLMVGWDWRRCAAWNVHFFLKTLIPAVQARATARGLGNVFQNTYLVGHSFGGMLVKWILNENTEAFVQNLKMAITVASPFYGSAGQVERLLVSMSPLTPPHYDLNAITKVISTLPGPYALFFLDKTTYATYGNQLQADPDFPLADYPCVDKSNPNVYVDPYEPPAPNPYNANLYRYPIKGQSAGNDWTGWFGDYLHQGLLDCQALALPLTGSLPGKLHNIRAARTSKGALVNDTKVGFSWDWYDVTKPRTPQASSVVSMTGGPGDGVVPAWSARLVTQDQGHIHNIRGDKDATSGVPALEHMTLMDYPAVRLQLLDLIRPGTEQIVVDIPTISPASVIDYTAALDELAKLGELPQFQKEERIREYINSIPRAQGEALMLRWIIEMPKGSLPIEPPRRR